MQAIQTRYHGPTSYKGSRIIAQCAAGLLIADYDDGLSLDDNHVVAAELLKTRLARKTEGEGSPWLRPTVAGTLADGSQVHVFVERKAEPVYYCLTCGREEATMRLDSREGGQPGGFCDACGAKAIKSGRWTVQA